MGILEETWTDFLVGIVALSWLLLVLPHVALLSQSYLKGTTECGQLLECLLRTGTVHFCLLFLAVQRVATQ